MAVKISKDFTSVLYVVTNQEDSVVEDGKEECDRLCQLERQMKEVKRILRNDIEKIVNRGEKLQDLVDRSQQLATGAMTFHYAARKLRRRTECKNRKIGIIIVAVVVSVISVPIVIRTTLGVKASW